ncbi:transmembrane protein 45B-like [Sceloporus undulatus]|uniref:transmembrane protein 45B-like n=1 Tax=Sceloporus undulatus TaxID=8520 RepID=UPI001C4C0854|nr:transmembrane protein 45B-like [Sceloporus undulatus]
MGSFLGHTLSGSLFLLLGFLWSIKHPLRFFSLKSKYAVRVEKYIDYMELLEWGGMIVFCFIGFLLEQFLPEGPHFHLYNKENHKWVLLNIWQHATMHIMFMFAGIAGVLVRCKFQVPLGMDYFLFSLALFIEGLLFYTHTDRLSSLDQYIHYIGIIPIWCGALCSLFEVWLRNNPILEQIRTSMFITQGTWMWQIGFVLYPRWGDPHWDHNDPATRMFMAMSYSWHFVGVTLFLAIMYGIVYWIFRRQKVSLGYTEMEILEFSNENTKTYTFLVDGSNDK